MFIVQLLLGAFQVKFIRHKTFWEVLYRCHLKTVNYDSYCPFTAHFNEKYPNNLTDFLPRISKNLTVNLQPPETARSRLFHCVRNDGGETKSRTKGHCEGSAAISTMESGKGRLLHCVRNDESNGSLRGQRGNLIKGTRKRQIASAKRPRNDGREKQIASLRSQ